MPTPDRFVQINRLQLHYLEWGDRGAPVVVLLHGGCAHAHWWDGAAAAISDGYHVLALDLRGHGESEWAVPAAYRVDDHADDLECFLSGIETHRVHLAGHSLGAMVAGTFAERHPERIQTLTLIDSPARISPSGARYMTRLRRLRQPIYRDKPHAVENFRLLPAPTNASPDLLAHIAGHAFRQLPDGRWTLRFDREALAHPEPQDLLPGLQSLECPILVLRGEHSTLLPRERFETILTAVPHARGHEILGAYHHVMLDNPRAFEGSLRGFLDAHSR